MGYSYSSLSHNQSRRPTLYRADASVSTSGIALVLSTGHTDHFEGHSLPGCSRDMDLYGDIVLRMPSVRGEHEEVIQRIATAREQVESSQSNLPCAPRLQPRRPHTT